MSLSRTHILIAAALVGSACASTRSPASTGSPDPDATPPATREPRATTQTWPDDAQSQRILGRHHLAYAATVESSCSQSWDISTWSGEVALDLQDGGAARLELAVRLQSRGGAQAPAPSDPSSYERPQRTCTFDGAWTRDDAGLTVTFPRRAGDAETYECRPGRGALETPADEPWVLRCVPRVLTLPEGSRSGPPIPEGVLGCASAGGTPWIWNLVLDDGVELHFGDLHAVFAESEHGDDLRGEILLPKGQVIEPPPGPTEWLVDHPRPSL